MWCVCVCVCVRERESVCDCVAMKSALSASTAFGTSCVRVCQRQKGQERVCIGVFVCLLSLLMP